MDTVVGVGQFHYFRAIQLGRDTRRIAWRFYTEDLYKSTNPNSSSLDELEREDFINFVNDHSEQNSECLLYSIQEKHFN